jgi:hypothetical protein
MFKELKQILRKEQCDASILLTANVPSAKKIIVHGPQGKKKFKARCRFMWVWNSYLHFLTFIACGSHSSPVLVLVQQAPAGLALHSLQYNSHY